MKVSALEEYGLRCLVQLARGQLADAHAATETKSASGAETSADTESAVVTMLSTREIAAREGLSVEYTAQILASMRKAGLVTSTRGVNGGFQLARPAAKISVGEMFRALDGEFADDLCDHFTGQLETCANAGDCNVAPVWTELSRRIYGFLDSVSLADIADGNVARAPQVIPLASLKRR